MKKPIDIEVLNRWDAAITSEGNDLYIKIKGLAYIYDSIKENGIEGAKEYSGFMKDFDIKACNNDKATEKEEP